MGKSKSKAPREAVATQKQAWLPIERLSVDPRYERPLNDRKVARIAGDFDPDAVGTVCVSDRGRGELVILDGQHRVAALRAMGWEDQSVPCLVYSGLTIEGEARVFRIMNEGRTKPRPADLFRARLIEGDRDAVAITKLLADLGLELGDGSQMGRVQCVASVDLVYRMAGPRVLRLAIETCMSAWGRESTAFQADLVVALALVWRRYESEMDGKRLARVLSRTTPAHLLASARAMKATMTASNVAYGVLPMAIVGAYNSGLRNASSRLPQWDDRTGRGAWSS